MIKPEPPKPPPMREIRDDASSALALPFGVAAIALLVIGLIMAFAL